MGEEQENRQAQVGEDWQLSQFWYSEATAGALAGAVLSAAGPAGRVACVSAPTLYTACRARTPDCRLDLFEYDKRFAVHGSDFHLYDYKTPLQLDSELRGQFDLVFADPPFLSEECLTKTLVTVRWMGRPGARLGLCTGAVMAELAARLAQLQPCRFTPEHEKSLSNPFQCFAISTLTNMWSWASSRVHPHQKFDCLPAVERKLEESCDTPTRRTQ